MPDRSKASSSRRLAVLITAYYVVSTLTGILTKQALTKFPRPLTVSLVQQIVVLFGGVARVESIGTALAEWRAVLPVAITLLFSVVLYRISLMFNTLSFAQVQTCTLTLTHALTLPNAYPLPAPEMSGGQDS